MENNVLRVIIWGMEVGCLYWHKEKRRAYFTYSQDFLSKGLDIAPLTASIFSPISQRGLNHMGNTDRLISHFMDYAETNALDRKWAKRIEQRLREINALLI